MMASNTGSSGPRTCMGLRRMYGVVPSRLTLPAQRSREAYRTVRTPDMHSAPRHSGHGSVVV